ncbi:conserved hypothetical protein [Lodderomyces elongisporus NRRL YB-4239]|uniref:Uncharacterized protein n=1 Tax=Lodderomyces elongisporus (strain ATCC 11503 / CBS 2605 / JCM 1781 / NBRC 1676 / NRRL YB-4239) TaxID=379508 RepID=A5E746_LODEL|nr:conserved hypothetical protein [Lodderomyces elongisporus NRRL YB-4239]
MSGEEETKTPQADGASYREQILESARRNNTELLLQIKSELGNDQEKLAHLINESREVITNNTPLHLACNLGNWEFIDIVLDIEGVEIDPQNREKETPLHVAAKYAVNEPEHGCFVIDNMLDAGADPRIKDQDGLKPRDYVSKDNEKLLDLLESAEYAISMEPREEDQLREFEAREAGTGTGNGNGVDAKGETENGNEEGSASGSESETD